MKQLLGQWKKILRDKAKRLKIETLFRVEDDTIAFYMPLEDKVHIFIDAWAKNIFDQWRFVAKTLKIRIDLQKFLQYSLSKTYMHELIHWASEEADDYQTDCMSWRVCMPRPLDLIYEALYGWKEERDAEFK